MHLQWPLQRAGAGFDARKGALVGISKARIRLGAASRNAPRREGARVASLARAPPKLFRASRSTLARRDRDGVPGGMASRDIALNLLELLALGLRADDEPDDK